MGRMRHDAIVMVVSDYVLDGRDREVAMPDVEAFRAALPPDFRDLLVGPVTAPVNGYVMYVFLPDGSKEGWDMSDQGDEYRQEFRDLFAFTYEDGSSPFDGVAVTFGGDGPSVLASPFPRKAQTDGDV